MKRKKIVVPVNIRFCFAVGGKLADAILTYAAKYEMTISQALRQLTHDALKQTERRSAKKYEKIWGVK